MSYFEQELRKAFAGSDSFAPRFIGRSCYGKISEDTSIKLEFVTRDTYGKYEGIRARILHQSRGELDSLTVWFADLWGVKKVDNPNFREGLTPYLWEYQGKAEWYVYQPTPRDMEQLREAFDAYAELYQSPAMEMQM